MDNKIKSNLDIINDNLLIEFDKFKNLVVKMNENDILDNNITSELLKLKDIKNKKDWIEELYKNNEQTIIINSNINNIGIIFNMNIPMLYIKIDFNRTIDDLIKLYIKNLINVFETFHYVIYFSDTILNYITISHNYQNRNMKIYELDDIYKPNLKINYYSSIIVLKILEDNKYFLFDNNEIISDALHLIKEKYGIKNVMFFCDEGHEITNLKDTLGSYFGFANTPKEITYDVCYNDLQKNI